MPTSRRPRRMWDTYRFLGFRPRPPVTGIFGDPHAHVHPHAPVKKTACGTCGRAQRGWYDGKRRQVRDLACGDLRIYLDVEVRRVACQHCGKVKQERLGFLADSPLYTNRVPVYVGRRCRASPIRDVANGLRHCR